MERRIKTISNSSIVTVSLMWRTMGQTNPGTSEKKKRQKDREVRQKIRMIGRIIVLYFLVLCRFYATTIKWIFIFSEFCRQFGHPIIFSFGRCQWYIQNKMTNKSDEIENATSVTLVSSGMSLIPFRFSKDLKHYYGLRLLLLYP